MPGFPALLALFIGIPLIEIYLLIKVGGWIGAIPTLLCIVGTALLGAALLRAQGIQTVQKIQSQLNMGELPADAMLEGVLLLAGGFLLLTPGFFTDFIGFLCLIPMSRRWLVKWLQKRMLVVTARRHSVPSGQNGSTGDSVIEGEVIDHRPDRNE